MLCLLENYYWRYTSASELVNMILLFIETRAYQVFQCPDFLSLSESIVQMIMARNLEVPEVRKFEAMLQWAKHKIRTRGAANMVVAVLDSGILKDHPDLNGQYLAGYDFIDNAAVANDGDRRDSDPSDPGDWITAAEDKQTGGFFYGCGASNSSWHGTQVASIIAAAANNGIGIRAPLEGDAAYVGMEIQVLDNYNNRTYSNGQAGAIYKQLFPLVNVCRPPGEWQTYDVIFTAPRFTKDGRLISQARITAFQNGVLIQNNAAIWGGTEYIGIPEYVPHGDKEPIVLQDHGNPVSYRNIWVREL